ncbi:alanine racemase [Gammaproteobacteria bacterium]|nr:alanine racemase [Gammaproteobacteria bacterium]
MSRPVWARINLDALHHNLQQVRILAPSSSVVAVVKANAYGHSAVGVAQSIEGQVDAFAVAGIGEADELIAAGITRDILLLSGFHQDTDIAGISEQGLIPVIHSWQQIDQLVSTSVSRPLRVWLKFDSGMHRIGFDPEEVGAAVGRLQQIPQVVLNGLMSHLASADDRDSTCTDSQIDVFTATTAPYHFEKSLANSAGVCAWPRSHHDWVRPGIMLYGCSPMLERDDAAAGLSPVMSLCSRIIAVKRLKQGDRIGYGGDWCCPENMSVGVVACGYGDGYPRHAPSGTPTWIKGRRAPLVGRVSMDMLTVDLRGLDSAGVGDEVELWGGHISATEVAALSGTISYEILTGVTARVPRVMERADSG